MVQSLGNRSVAALGFLPQVTGKIDKNSKYLSVYFSVCQICQLCLDKANDNDVYHTKSSGLELFV